MWLWSVAIFLALGLALAQDVQEELVRESDAVVASGSRRFSVRLLSEDSSPYQGRLLLSYEGSRWQTVCVQRTDDVIADVVCRQLYGGTPHGHHGTVVPTADRRHQRYEGDISYSVWPGSVRCRSTDSSIDDCRITWYDDMDHVCDHRGDVYISCRTPRTAAGAPAHVGKPRPPLPPYPVRVHPLPSHHPMGIRLVGGQSPSEGLVQVRVRNSWRTVCNTAFDHLDAFVACKQLGYLDGDVVQPADQYVHLDEAKALVWMDVLDCSGREQSLDQCPHLGYGRHRCYGLWDAAAVRCNVRQYAPYITPQYQPPLVFRLYSGTAADNGLVQVLVDDEWRYVCADNWDDLDSAVLCTQLGYSHGGSAIQVAGTTREDYRFWLDEVTCDGGEARLDECPSVRHGLDVCSMNHPAATACNSPPPPPPPPPPPSTPARSTVRLVGGDVTYGLVWVEVEGERSRSGYLCHDGFDPADAQVACMNLGNYNNYHIVQTELRIPERDKYDILTESLACLGTERQVAECMWTERQRCATHEIAALRCY